MLLAVTFYNGRHFARRTIETISHLDHSGFELDVLVLDDASPEPGFSEYLAGLAREIGATYYRSPRNQGIPRNVNLGMATAQRLGYDYVVISNSDVIYSRESLGVLLHIATTTNNVASVTAWSTNVDPYSLPNGVEAYPENQETADLVGAALSAEYGHETLKIPAGISFAMLVPVAVLDTVGYMDPVFGRGYGEESDWSARATSLGYDHVLAKGAFVYHAGRGSTLAAGVVSEAEIADWGNQRIVEHRSPMFRWAVDGFMRSGELEVAQVAAVRCVILAAATRNGYVLVDDARIWDDVEADIVTVAIRSEEHEMCTAHWCGFTTEIDTDTIDVVGAVMSFFGGMAPMDTNIRPAASGPVAQYGYPLAL